MDYSDITIKDKFGRTLYFPRDYQFIRYAPAACCQVVARITQLRDFLNKALKEEKIDVETYKMLQPFVAPVVMEKDFLSGKIVEVHGAIEELIKNVEKVVDNK